MAEESKKPMELNIQGEAPSLKDSPTHASSGKIGNDSSSRNSLSSGTPGSLPRASPSRESSREKDKSVTDREERVRLLREKQAEDRQRKLEELKTAAFQAQKYREQQEEDRRRKIEELKLKENERRYQVEERKKQICGAEIDRRESLLRRSHDREARIEAQRNAHRSSIGFAFGSSTPRLLESDSSFSYNSRRTASQVQLNQPPLTTSSSSQTRLPAANATTTGTGSKDNEGVVRRRLGTSHSVDRGMDPVAHRHTIHESFIYGTSEPSKTSNSLNNKNIILDTISDGYVHYRHSIFPWEIAEQRNSHTTNPADNRMSGLLFGSGVLVGDIMTQSFTSVSTYNRGRRRTDLIPTIPIHKDNPRTSSPAASSPSRPQSSMSQQSLSSHSTSSVSLRAKPTPRKSRPLSVAGSTPDRSITEQRQVGMPPTGRPPRAKSAGSDNVLKEVKSESGSPTPPVPTTRRHPTSKTSNTNSSSDKPKIAPKPSLQQQTSKVTSPLSPTREQSFPPPNEIKPETNQINANEINNQMQVQEMTVFAEIPVTNGFGNNHELPVNEVKEISNEETQLPCDTVVHSKMEENSATLIPSKTKITTEEEAKAVLAEKRRQAREQAEREAELERHRQEELERLEEERIRREEEEQRLWEEEVERQRKAEEVRLQKAIEEQQKREEEERLKKEEEAKQKIEREKAEQQAREEQDKLRKEADEKFLKEEEERIKRRKRVEDIMSRTRARDNAKKEGQPQTPTQNEDLTSSFSESFILKTEASTLPVIERDHLNNKQQNGSSLSTNGQTLINPEESLLDLDTLQTNGFNNYHQFHMNNEKDYHSNTGDSLLDSQCLTGFDLLTPTKITTTSTSNYDESTSASNIEDHLSNEDNVNFNIVPSPNGIDNYPNHQDTGVTDLLS